MKITLAAALLACTASAAGAAGISADLQPLDMPYDLAALPGSQSYQVHLDAGHDYAIASFGDENEGTLRLRAAGGMVLTSARVYDSQAGEPGATFHALYTGDYTLTVDVPGPSATGGGAKGQVLLAPDCRANRKTRCAIPVGGIRDDRPLNYDGDKDWFATNLRKGATYVARVEFPRDDGDVAIDVRDATGRKIAPGVASVDFAHPVAEVRFKAPSTGRFFIEVENGEEYQNRYRLTVAQVR